MGDIKSPRLIFIKGVLFLLGTIISAGLLLVHAPTLKVALLLAICIWCSCRFYYFAFYVIERYVDDQFRFAGLLDFLKYLARRRGNRS